MANDISELIRAARAASNMTQAAMASALGMSTVSVSNWENGKVPLTLDKLQRWYDALPDRGREVMRHISIFD